MRVSVFAPIFVFGAGGYEGYVYFAGDAVALLGISAQDYIKTRL